MFCELSDKSVALWPKARSGPVAFLFTALGLTTLFGDRLAFGEPVAIQSGLVWRDTGGQVIQAHGGGILQVSNTFFWFGEDRSTGPHCQSIRCYASTDLKNWTFRSTVLSAQASPALAGINLERPKVLFHEATRQYVMWVHKENTNDYGEARALVATGETPDGSYVCRREFRPLGNMSRDCTLFKDDDGAAYFVSSANHNADLLCYRLTPDYLDVERQWTLLKGQSREAPTLFKRNGLYHLITSACTAWGPNGNTVATATNIFGPYSQLTVLCNKDTWNTYCSQTAFVLPVKGTRQTNWVFMADRWKGWNLADSRYMFLPLRFDEGGRILPVQWGDSWTLDTVTGEATFPVAPKPAPNNIARGRPCVATVGNTRNGNEAASAFDGNARTKWCAEDGDYPHWLMVDLGVPEPVSKSEIIWERDDGTIYQYKIESSNDGTTWTTVVDRIAHTNGTQIVQDECSARARYFRLRVLGCKPPPRSYAWACLYEWRLFHGTVNVALNKVAWADSEQAGTYSAKGNDGNFCSTWFTSRPALTNWWKVDLGRSTNLTGCRLMWHDPGFLYRYRIEVSPDDTRWTTAVDMTANPNVVWMPVHAFTAKDARFLRVSVTALEDGCWWGIREVEVFDSLPLPPGAETISPAADPGAQRSSIGTSAIGHD